MGIPFEPVQVAWPGRPYFQSVPMELPSLEEELPMTVTSEEVVRRLREGRGEPDQPAIVEAAPSFMGVPLSYSWQLDKPDAV